MSESITPIGGPVASRRANYDPPKNIVGASNATIRPAKRVSSPVFIKTSSAVFQYESGRRLLPR
jgi:hypothetical protein